MYYEVTWTSKDQDQNPRVKKLVFTVGARNAQEAIDWTTDFLGRNTGAPVLALWECNMVNEVK